MPRDGHIPIVLISPRFQPNDELTEQPANRQPVKLITAQSEAPCMEV
jgi:hypothetical protein